MIDALATAERLAAFLGRTVAVSRPFTEPSARPAAEAAARATLEAAALLVEPPAVARAARMPAYLLVGNVRNLPDGVRQAHELLDILGIARLEELADWDLTDPELRFALELAVRIVQNAQA